jgi:uncharacterized protein (TIGR03435 family)
MRFLTGLSAALLLAALFPAPGQQAPAPAPGPAFEVASVKPAPPIEPAKIIAGKMHVGMSVDAARVDIGNLSLADLIKIAYKLKSYQLTAPDWASTERFDIMAKMPEGGTKEQVPQMLQALLAERFKLTMHRETKDHAVYALIAGKNGPKMKETIPDTPAPVAAGDDPPAPAGSGGLVIGKGENQMRVKQNSDGKGTTMTGPFGQVKTSMVEGGMLRMEFSKMTMPALAEMITRFADRPVLDMTELKGNYQVALDLSMEDMKNVARASGVMAGMGMPQPGTGKEAARPGDAASTPAAASIFAAVQQLGLKLDARKWPVEIVVIDHLEKTPTEN